MRGIREPQKRGVKTLTVSFSSSQQISLDDEELAQHPATTEDIRMSCQDIKVLGRKELRYAVGVGVGARSLKSRERHLKAMTLYFW